MIDRRVFADAWALLADRFGRQPNEAQARAYHRYLSPQMDTAEFQEAVRALWSTREFFPRPADFLLVRAAIDWPVVQRACALHHGPDWLSNRAGDGVIWQVSERGQQAVWRLGGLEGVKTLLEKDPERAKRAWEHEYEQAVAAAALALPAPEKRRAVSAGHLRLESGE